MESILTYLLDKFPIIAFFLVALLVVGIACWRLSKWHESYKKVSEKVNNAPCASHEQSINKLTDISNSIRKIEEWIVKQDINAMNDLVRKCSPYQLTDVGVLVLEASGGKEFVDSNLDRLIDELKKAGTETLYDTEKNALFVLSNMMEDEIFNVIKDYIYNSPKEIELNNNGTPVKAEINMNRLLMVMSIYLRNRYIEIYQKE